jgi:probable dihydroxyacetone kinase regulator
LEDFDLEQEGIGRMGELTKRRLANSLKKLMAVKPFEKISAREIVEGCGYNRQTFYYHFQDIYELGKWMFEQDVSALMRGHDQVSTWEEGVLQLFNYFQENKAICLCALDSLGHDQVKYLVYAHIHDILKKIVDTLSADLAVDDEYKNFVAHFYAEAFAGVAESWLREPPGKAIPPEKLIGYLRTTLAGNLRGALVRYAGQPNPGPG